MKLFAFLWLAAAQAQPLEQAYRALEARAYDAAVASFREAVRREPERAAIRKDLAYTYLKIGLREEARDQFRQAMTLDATDSRAALEYAFLCFETQERAEARRTFERLRNDGDAGVRATAAQAFDDIDRELREGIARWSAALATTPDNHSAALELARLAADRDELALAAENYARAIRLKPSEHSLLIELARLLRRAGRNAEADAALEQAWRSGSPRVAEAAREMLPRLGERAPARPPAAVSAREMGFRSYDAGYLSDALRYLNAAHETDPSDYAVMLKLGWTYNVLKRDNEAVEWFDRARRSPDPAIAAEAAKAYRNLRQSKSWTRATVWLYPFYSSRWTDVFGYGQAKLELRTRRLPVHPYLTLRFIGDTRRRSGRPLPEYLSESAFLPGIGVSAAPARGLTLWAEAAVSVGYWTERRPVARTAADYRAGLSLARGFGNPLGGESKGAFAQTENDIVFISRFNNDVIAYSQNKVGYTMPVPASGLQMQMYWSANVTQDVRRESWSDFIEFGPGIRLRFKSWPPSLVVSAGVLRGVYTRNEGNPRRPNFNDVRVGFWYAFSR